MANRGFLTLPAWCLATLFVVANASAASSSPQLQSGQDPARATPRTPKEQLAGICKTHPQEPACGALADLSEDEAWLVLREACRGDDGEECKRFRLNQGGVLVYDMKGDEWKAEWESRSYPLAFDVAGVPTMQLRPSHAKPLKILITGVSPLTYSAAPGTPKEQDLGVIADLETFLALAGAGVRGLVQTLAFSAAAGLPTQTTATDVKADREASDVDRRWRERAERQRRTSTANCGDVDPPSVGPLASTVRERAQQLVALNQALERVDAQLGSLEARKAGFVEAAQRAEDGKPVGAKDFPAGAFDLTAYDDLSLAAGKLAEATGPLVACQPLLGAYETLLGAHPKPAVVSAFAEDVLATTGCESFQDTIFRNVRGLKTLAANSCDAELKARLDMEREMLKPYVERLSDVRSPESKLWQAIDKVMGAKRDVLAGAATLEREIVKARRHTWNGRLIPELVVTRQNPSLGWRKVQTHSIVIKADSPYVKELTLSRGAEEKREYKLESATGRILGYGIGLVYTPLYESTFTAATVPGTKEKVIAETGRETRAGDLAAFISYRFLEHRPAKRPLEPTLDFGVGLTSGRTALFVGFGGELFHAARIAFGWTAQRVTVLEPGQELNRTIVSSNDDIRTRTQFDTGHYYVSFSFALDSLPLFTK